MQLASNILLTSLCSEKEVGGHLPHIMWCKLVLNNMTLQAIPQCRASGGGGDLRARTVQYHGGPCTAHSPKPFLGYSIPDLQFDLLARDLHYSHAKLHTDSVRAVGHDWGGRKPTAIVSYAHSVSPCPITCTRPKLGYRKL